MFQRRSGLGISKAMSRVLALFIPFSPVFPILASTRQHFTLDLINHQAPGLDLQQDYQNART